jgi:hypothetical protein
MGRPLTRRCASIFPCCKLLGRSTRRRLPHVGYLFLIVLQICGLRGSSNGKRAARRSSRRPSQAEQYRQTGMDCSHFPSLTILQAHQTDVTSIPLGLCPTFGRWQAPLNQTGDVWSADKSEVRAFVSGSRVLASIALLLATSAPALRPLRPCLFFYSTHFG